MSRARSSPNDDLFRLVSSLSIVLRAEADKLDKLGIQNQASDMGKITVDNDHATTAYVLRSLANWIEQVIGKRF